ncbi:aldehyde dehydrogenase family protein [Candidatus Woesearchaeota archaeon]|nr:aldehyde dehydrogenase family protein [Candidatus Woesearchaeota archaeon]
MVTTYKHHIGGKWIRSFSGKTFMSINPANKAPVGKFQQGNRQDIDAAVRAATSAFKSWKDVPAPKRGEILLRAAQILRKRKEKFARIVTKEMGKVISEGRGDVQEAIDIFEYMAGEGRRLFGHTTPSELRNKFCMTFRQPLGVVGLITPWNFPIAIPAWKLAPALICGNSVIFKPSSDTPLCATKLVALLIEAGIPSGVLNLVTGSGNDVGMALVKHPSIRGISFTGSRTVGEKIVQYAGLKRVGLELGGKNPIIIMEDADLELAVEGVIWGGFGTTGQRCTAASRVIVHHKVKKQFEKRLLDHIKKLRVGDGIKKTTDVGPLINQKAVEKVHGYTLIGKQEGARLLHGGRFLNKKGFFYEPTVFSDVSPSMRIAQEEIFGPSISIIAVKDIKEAIDVCNRIEYGLSSSIYTNNIQNAFLAIEKIEAGITYVNASTIGSEVHLPFGGVKLTGNGTREAGIEGIYEFSETKTIYVDYSGKLQKAQIDDVMVR